MNIQPARRAKIVFINRYFDPDESATSQLLTDLARALVKHGYDVHVVCSRQLYLDPGANLAAHEELAGVNVHRVTTTHFGRGALIGRSIDYASFYVSSGLALMNLLRDGDVVIAKTDPPLISILAALVARQKNGVLINWQQDVFPEVASRLGISPLPHWFDAQLRRLRDWSMRAAKMNVLIGNRMLEYFQERGIPGTRLCVIENWADADAMAPKPREASRLRESLGLRDKFVVCYSGNLGRAHEFDTLVSAADELRNDRTVAFLVIGGGAKMESLRDEVATRSLENFCFLPSQPRGELEDSLSAADLHVASLLPQLEGLIVPSKMYGILAAGRPLVFIGDPNGEIARVIRETECGITVPVGGGADLAQAIRRLHLHPDTCAAMGTNARAVLLSRYSRVKAIERWVSVLDERGCGSGFS